MAEELDKKTAEDISNLRKAEAEITKELITLREKLKTLSSEDVVNLKEAANIQFKLLDLEKEKRGISKEIVDINGKVFDSDEKRQEISQSIFDLQKDTVDMTKDILKNSEELGKESEKIKIQQDTILAIQKDINRYEIDIKKNRESISESAKNAINQTSSQKKLDEYINQTLESRSQLLQDAQSANVADQQELIKLMRRNFETSALMSEVQQDMASAAEEAAKGSFKKLSMDRELLGIANIELDIAAAKAKGDQSAVNFYTKQKEGLEAIVAAKTEANSLNEKDSVKQKEILDRQKEMKDVIDQSGMNKMFDGVEGAVKKIPGGGVLLKTLGFDKMKENITKNLGNSMMNITAGFQQGGVAGFKAMGLAAKQFGMALLAGPQVVIFGILAAVGLIIAAFAGVDKEVSEVQKSLGGNKKEARETLDTAKKMSAEMKITGLNAGELAKSMAQVSESMGGLDVASISKGTGEASEKMKRLVKDTAILGEKFGLSADEIDNMRTLSTITGKSIGQLTNDTVKMGKGLMTDKAAMKTLAAVPKEVAVAFKGGTDSLIKASQKAKLLGTDLKRVQEIGDGLLDIESSLAKEMEARVLTGKNLNLDKAREYALSGEIGKLQDTLLEEAGSLSEFTEMNRIQQKAMADAMGMSVEEMTSMLSKAQELKDVGLSSEMLEQKHLQNAKGLREEAEKMRKSGKAAAADKLEALAADKDSATFADKLADVMKKIQQSAEKLITPLVDMVHAMFEGGDAAGSLFSIFDGIMDILKPIMESLFAIGSIIYKVMTFPMRLFFSLLGPIFDALKEIFSVFGSGAEGAGGIATIFKTISGVLDTIFSVVSNIGKGIIEFLITPTKMLWKAIVTPLWESFQGIFKTFQGLYEQVKKAFEPLFGANKGAKETAGFTEIIGKGFEILGKIIAPIGKLIAGLIIKPLEMVTLVISAIVKLFTGDVTGALQDVGTWIFKYFFGMPKMILEAITGVIDGIFGTNLTEGVTGFFDSIKKMFQGFTGLFSGAGTVLMDLIITPFKSLWDIGQGIIKMFTGDFVGGLKQIGSAIGKFLFNEIYGLPKLVLTAITGIIDGIFGTNLTKGVTGFFDWIQNTFMSVFSNIAQPIFEFVVKPFTLLWDVAKAIIKMFTGDFVGGMKDIGSAIGEFLFGTLLGLPKIILTAITSVIDAIFGTNLTKSVGAFFDFVKDIFKTIGSFVWDIGASIIKYLMRPFDLVKGLISGIVQIFTGDFKGGLETIGKAILDFLMAPVTLVQDIFKKFVGLFESIGSKIKNAVKDILPDWALKLLGMGGEEKQEASKSAGQSKQVVQDLAKEKQEEGKKEGGEKKIGAAATGGTISKGGATLVGEKGPEVVSLPQGSVVASASSTKQIGSALSSAGKETSMGETPELAVLKSIDAKIGIMIEKQSAAGLDKLSSIIGNTVGNITSPAKAVSSTIGGAMSGIASVLGISSSTQTSSGPGVVQSRATTPAGPESVEKVKSLAAQKEMETGTSTKGAGTSRGDSNAAVVEKLDKLIAVLSSITSQPTIIKIGEKTVEEIQSTIDLRKSYNVAIDNTYGRRI